MAIVFKQYLMPNGRVKDVLTERPPDIEALAQAVIGAGGYFEAEVLRTGEVSFTVEHRGWEDKGPVAIEVVSNGPGVPEAVDRLVRAAHERLVRT